MKAVLHYRASPGFRARIAASAPPWLSVAVVDEVGEDAEARFAAAMRDADVLLHVLAHVSGAAISGAPALKLIQKIGVGVNTIDLETAKARRVAVCNMPGTNSQAVAEATLALMLAALRQVVELDRATREGRGWTLPLDTFDRVGEIHGRTVGLVGFGEIPRRLAPVLQALGARVLYTARSPRADATAEFVPLDELFARADIVSLHLPLVPQTERLVSAGSIATMKPGAILVNTARGGLVDEAALVEALRSGRLAAAGLDVFAVEPVPAGQALLALPNVVALPHVAWLTPETLNRSLGIAFENCRRIRDGEPLLHRVV